MGDESSFPTTREKGSSIVIMISLNLDPGPGKGPGSSYSHIFPHVTSSNNNKELNSPYKFQDERTIPTNFQPGHYNIGAKILVHDMLRYPTLSWRPINGEALLF